MRLIALTLLRLGESLLAALLILSMLLWIVIYLFLVFLGYFDLLFVWRTRNCATYYLARKASSFANSVWVENGPAGIDMFPHSDVLASILHS